MEGNRGRGTGRVGEKHRAVGGKNGRKKKWMETEREKGEDAEAALFICLSLTGERSAQ